MRRNTKLNHLSSVPGLSVEAKVGGVEGEGLGLGFLG